MCVFAIIFLCGAVNAAAQPRGIDVTKMAMNMTDYDPNNVTMPTGDTIKIGLIDSFSGPAAGNGEIYWLLTNWVVHDLNKRGGIKVDGNIKKIEIIKGDSQGKPVICKKVAEKLCLEDKVDLLWGCAGSHLTLIIQNVAKKYETVHLNGMSNTTSLLDGSNFNRYTFRTCYNTEMFGLGMAYFYSKRPENKFYILCQDYMFGHNMGKGFKEGLKKYKPNAEIIGEVYHPLFMKDFAPYMTKIQAANPDVIFTSDWMPDGQNLIKTARSLGINIPIATRDACEPVTMKAIGGPAGIGMVQVNDHSINCDTPENKVFNKTWNDLWKQTWGKPYNTDLYMWPITVLGSTIGATYWYFDIVERIGATDPEKVIAEWEDDEFKVFSGVIKMRACDHQVLRPMFATEYAYPNKWYPDAAGPGTTTVVAPEFCTPAVAADLDRCNK